MSKVQKAIAGFVTTAITGAGTLLALNILTGDAKNTVIAILAAVTPIATYLGVYVAPKNAQ